MSRAYPGSPCFSPTTRALRGWREGVVLLMCSALRPGWVLTAPKGLARPCSRGREMKPPQGDTATAMLVSGCGAGSCLLGVRWCRAGCDALRAPRRSAGAGLWGGHVPGALRRAALLQNWCLASASSPCPLVQERW